MKLTRGTARRHVAAALFLSLIGAQASAQFSVNPSELQLAPRVRPGASFTVTNDDRDVVQATLYLNDWDRSEDGENQFDTLGTSPSSCRDRVEVFPLTVRVAPGVSQAIRVALKATDTLSTPCWTIVFVESAPRPSAGNVRISYVTRLGVKVYVSPASVTTDAEIVGFAAEPIRARPGVVGDSTKRELAVYVRNLGGGQVRFKGQIEIRRPDNSLATSIPIEETPVLPGSTRRIGVAIPALPAGRYIALAVVGFGGQDDLAAQAEVTLP